MLSYHVTAGALLAVLQLHPLGQDCIGDNYDYGYNAASATGGTNVRRIQYTAGMREVR